MWPVGDLVERPRPRALRPAALAGIAAGLTAALGLWLARPATLLGRAAAVVPEATPLLYRAPASWKLASGELQVLDADGRQIFSRALGIAVDDASSDGGHAALGTSAVQFADLDADGRDEILLVPSTADAAASRLYCFDAGGGLRFTYKPNESVRFGETSYGGPWRVSKAVVTRGADGSRSLWVLTRHATLFPSSLKELDDSGNVRSEYWSSGPIEHVSEHHWRGEAVVLVGAADEDRQGSSLALFGRAEVAGSAPALRAGYDCTSCALSRPREYLFFPHSCQSRGATPVWDAWVEPGDRLSVATELARVSIQGDGPAGAAFAYYIFDSDLSLVHAEISREFQVAHRGLERKRLVDHAFGPRDDAALFPVQRFDGVRRTVLAAVPVGH